MSDQTEQTITVNGTSYALADLSDEARQQIVNIRFVDQELERLNNQAAIARAARKAYEEALTRALPNQS